MQRFTNKTVEATDFKPFFIGDGHACGPNIAARFAMPRLRHMGGAGSPMAYWPSSQAMDSVGTASTRSAAMKRIIVFPAFEPIENCAEI